MADNIIHPNMLFYPLFYNTIISLTSLNITQAFHLLLGFAENQIVFWDFKIKNSIRIIEIRIIKVLLYTYVVCMYVYTYVHIHSN